MEPLSDKVLLERGRNGFVRRMSHTKSLNRSPRTMECSDLAASAEFVGDGVYNVVVSKGREACLSSCKSCRREHQNFFFDLFACHSTVTSSLTRIRHVGLSQRISFWSAYGVSFLHAVIMFESGCERLSLFLLHRYCRPSCWFVANCLSSWRASWVLQSKLRGWHWPGRRVV